MPFLWWLTMHLCERVCFVSLLTCQSVGLLPSLLFVVDATNHSGDYQPILIKEVQYVVITSTIVQHRMSQILTLVSRAADRGVCRCCCCQECLYHSWRQFCLQQRSGRRLRNALQCIRTHFLSNLSQNALLSNGITALYNSSSTRLFEGWYCLLGVQCCGSYALVSPSVSVEVRIRGVSLMVRTEVVAANIKVEAPITSSLSSPIPSLLRPLFNEVILCLLYGRQRKKCFVQILSPLERSQSARIWWEQPMLPAVWQGGRLRQQHERTIRQQRRCTTWDCFKETIPIVLLECFMQTKTGYSGFTYIWYCTPNLQYMWQLEGKMITHFTMHYSAKNLGSGTWNLNFV